MVVGHFEVGAFLTNFFNESRIKIKFLKTTKQTKKGKKTKKQK